MPFEKGQSGNPSGKPKGAKSEKTTQWELLHSSIVGQHADRFNTILKNWAESGDPDQEQMFSDAYIKVLEYFKPKQARVSHVGETDAPITIVIPREI